MCHFLSKPSLTHTMAIWLKRHLKMGICNYTPSFKVNVISCQFLLVEDAQQGFFSCFLIGCKNIAFCRRREIDSIPFLYYVYIIHAICFAICGLHRYVLVFITIKRMHLEASITTSKSWHMFGLYRQFLIVDFIQMSYHFICNICKGSIYLAT